MIRNSIAFLLAAVGFVLAAVGGGLMLWARAIKGG